MPATDRVTRPPAQASPVVGGSIRKPMELALNELRKKMTSPKPANAHCEIAAET
jgi:hypothetical protein